MYAASRIQTHRSVQENLRIYMFATKHNLTIEQVEIMLNCSPEELLENDTVKRIRNERKLIRE